MAGGYHRLSEKDMLERDNTIIRLLQEGVGHKAIAHRVYMEPSGLETRLHKLRVTGKLPAVGGSDG